MCTTASDPYSSQVHIGSFNNGRIKSNSLKSHTEELPASEAKTAHDRTGNASLLPHRPRRANSIAAIRPLWVHAEQGLEMKPFEPCMNLSQGRTLGNAQMPICYSMSSLNVSAGLMGCNKCHIPRQNSECLLSKPTISEVVAFQDVQCKCQEANKHVISHSAMTLCPVDLHRMGASIVVENSDSYKPGRNRPIVSNKDTDLSGKKQWYKPCQPISHAGSSERYRRYIRNRNPRILYVESKHEGTWV